MDKKQKLTGNKLIAEFMGLYPIKMTTNCGSCNKEHTIGSNIRYDKNYNVYCQEDCSDGVATIGGTTLEECWFGDGEGVDENSLLYNSSWDWLMPVVEKINSIVIESVATRVTMRINATLIERVGEEDWEAGMIITGKGMLTNTYEAIIQFIKWYNENKKE